MILTGQGGGGKKSGNENGYEDRHVDVAVWGGFVQRFEVEERVATQSSVNEQKRESTRYNEGRM